MITNGIFVYFSKKKIFILNKYNQNKLYNKADDDLLSLNNMLIIFIP